MTIGAVGSGPISFDGSVPGQGRFLSVIQAREVKCEGPDAIGPAFPSRGLDYVRGLTNRFIRSNKHGIPSKM